jgi:hypothetical protein
MVKKFNSILESEIDIINSKKKNKLIYLSFFDDLLSITDEKLKKELEFGKKKIFNFF